MALHHHGADLLQEVHMVMHSNKVSQSQRAAAESDPRQYVKFLVQAKRRMLQRGVLAGGTAAPSFQGLKREPAGGGAKGEKRNGEERDSSLGGKWID